MRNLTHPRGRVGVHALAPWLAYLVVFVLLFPLLDGATPTLALAPVLMTGWHLGLRAGLLSGLLSLPLHVLLLLLLGQPGLDLMLRTTGGLLGSIMLIVTGAVVGHISALRIRVKDELAERLRAEERTARSQRMLLALNGTAQAVQLAHTIEAVYRTIGDGVTRLGYQTVVFELSADQDLRLSYLSVEPALLHAAENIVGLPARELRIPIVPGSAFEQEILQGNGFFYEQVIEPISETFPHIPRFLLERATRLLGLEQAIFAPMNVEGALRGFLVITGRGLTENNVPAVTAFASQAAVALENVRLYAAMQQELAQRSHAEEALRESERRYRVLFEAMTEGFSLDEIICDEAGKPCDLRYLAVNPAFERQTGLKAADIIGRTTLELFPRAEPIWFERYGKVALTGEPAHFEEWFGPLGRWFRVSAFQTEPGRFAVLFVDVTDHRLAQQKIREYAAQLQALSRGLVEAQENERRAIARELHDEIGQVLTGLKILLEMIPRLPAEIARVKLTQAQTLVVDLMERISRVTLELRPPMLDDLGLLPTLLWYLPHYQTLTGVSVDFIQVGVEGKRFAPEIETAVFRIIQEALTNVARHAGVDRAQMRLAVRRGQIQVVIEDQGRGLDPEKVRSDRANGLVGMRERASSVCGEMTIDSAPGHGTRLTVNIPLRK